MCGQQQLVVLKVQHYCCSLQGFDIEEQVRVEEGAPAFGGATAPVLGGVGSLARPLESVSVEQHEEGTLRQSCLAKTMHICIYSCHDYIDLFYNIM